MPRCALYIHSLGTASAAGVGLNALRRTLFGECASGMRSHRGLAPQTNRLFHCGLVDAIKPDAGNDRTKALLDMCLAQMTQLPALLRKTDPERVAVVLGACTAGMHRVEEDMFTYARQRRLPETFDIGSLNLFEPSRHVAEKINACGPIYTVSNACASGLMAIESAARLLQADLADVVVTGGCDGFCQFTNAGFSALSAVSSDPCTPFDKNRKGINLGEGGALFAMSRDADNAMFAFSGMGLSTDAHHLSAPEPEGEQAAHAMRQALEVSGITPPDVDLVLAHGTGTVLNDAMEAKAVHAVFGEEVPCASYKALSGHTLAGAGALQAAIAAAFLIDNPQGRLAASAGLAHKDPTLAAANILTAPRALGRALRHVVANAFAFGGSNASAVFSRVSL